METRTMKLADIKPAAYNPRVKLTPKDQEYKALDASIAEHGLVLPLIVNVRDNGLIGGHRRLDVLLVDNAPAMVEACRERFKDDPSVAVRSGNLWEYMPFEDKASLVLSVLTIQFTPTAYRQKMITDIYNGLAPGGAFIFVEKVLCDCMDELMVELYYQMKRENGYTDEQIMSKRRSLENVLSPLKPAWNEDMLRTAGFSKVDMFWRCLNFCGWIAVK